MHVYVVHVIFDICIQCLMIQSEYLAYPLSHICIISLCWGHFKSSVLKYIWLLTVVTPLCYWMNTRTYFFYLTLRLYPFTSPSSSAHPHPSQPVVTILLLTTSMRSAFLALVISVTCTFLFFCLPALLSVCLAACLSDCLRPFIYCDFMFCIFHLRKSGLMSTGYFNEIHPLLFLVST